MLYVAEFYLLVFCWRSLLLYSWGLLVCGFLFFVLSFVFAIHINWFCYEGNASFIKLIEIFFLVCLLVLLGICQFYWLFHRTSSVSLIFFFFLFFCFQFHCFLLYLCFLSFCLLWTYFVHFFPIFLRWELRWLIWDFFLFLGVH